MKILLELAIMVFVGTNAFADIFPEYHSCTCQSYYWLYENGDNGNGGMMDARPPTLLERGEVNSRGGFSTKSDYYGDLKAQIDARCAQVPRCTYGGQTNPWNDWSYQVQYTGNCF